MNADLQPFEQITGLTDVAEGTIVRVITRLDETCREVRDAARVIGDAELFKKMEECQVKIKRDSKEFSSPSCFVLTPHPSRIRRKFIFLEGNVITWYTRPEERHFGVLLCLFLFTLYAVISIRAVTHCPIQHSLR